MHLGFLVVVTAVATVSGLRVGSFAQRTVSPRLSETSTLSSTGESELVGLLSASAAEGRGAGLSVSDVAKVHSLATALEQSAKGGDDTNNSPLLPGRWRVLYQGKPGGETVSAFSFESWKKYLSGDGPSPIQNLVSGSSGVSRLYQIVQLADDRSSGRILM